MKGRRESFTINLGFDRAFLLLKKKKKKKNIHLEICLEICVWRKREREVKHF